MQIGTISPSKLERIRLCESRVEAQLHDSEYEEEQGEMAKGGTLAHEAAKLWYRWSPAPDGSKTWPYTDPSVCFRAAMDSVSKREFTQGNNVIVNNELPHDAGTIQDARTSFDMIISHYKREVVNIIFTERRYKGTLKNGVPVHLIIDLALDRGNGTLEIVDYKTGFIACTTDDMWDKDQVLMNLLAVSLDPEFAKFTTFQFTYFWVKKGYETGPISLSGERLADYEHFLALEYTRIVEIEKPVESLNRFCGSCGRRTQCSKYREWMTEAMASPALLTPEQMVGMDDDILMGQHEKLKGQIKALENLREQLGDHIKAILTQRQVVELEGRTFKAVIRSSKHNTYSVPAVVALCVANQKDPSAVFSIKSKEVESLFSSDPNALQQLNLTMRRGQTAGSLNIVQVGVKKVMKPRKKKDVVETSQIPDIAIQPAPGTQALAQEPKL